MFERFTKPARECVVSAQVTARELGHTWIGTEHLLVTLLEQDDTVAARALLALGVTAEAVRTELAAALGTGFRVGDAEALGAIGIDLDEVRRRIEASFGSDALRRRPGRCGRRSMLSGHIPFTPRAKKVLELALREALRLGHNYISTEHILLGMIREGQGLALLLFVRLGVSPDAVRAKVLDELRQAS